MLYAKIELWPYGIEEEAKSLVEVMIANDGTGSPWVGSYQAVMLDHGKVTGCAVDEFPRDRGAAALLETVLYNMREHGEDMGKVTKKLTLRAKLRQRLGK